MQKILIVDDEKHIVDIVKYNLSREGFEVIGLYDGHDVVNIVNETKPDLIILDKMLPAIDGFSLCKILRTKTKIPILMLTACDYEADVVIGLELGADDYITKPFSMRELISRVKSNIRRVEEYDKPKTKEDTNILSFGKLEVVPDKYKILKNGSEVNLSLKEYELLYFLASREGEIFTRETLLEKVWKYTYFGDVRIVDVTIRRLRVKIEEIPSKPLYIHLKRGIGYYFSCKETNKY